MGLRCGFKVMGFVFGLGCEVLRQMLFVTLRIGKLWRDDERQK